MSKKIAAPTGVMPLSQMTTVQKAKTISFLSAVALVVGSAIGAGIFFKNGTILNSTGGDIRIAIGCWAIAALGIIAIGLALLEVATASKRNKGILGWTELFTFRSFHSWSKGYMAIFYYPTTMVTLPLYSVQALSDATGHNFPWWQILLLAMGLTAWLLFVSAISTKASSGINWIFTLIKFIPIFLVPIYGFVDAGSNGLPPPVLPDHSTTSLTAASPYLGLIASVPAIFFAFDGFYTVASISTDLKSPKRMPWAMSLGILIITAAYLLIAAGVFVSSEGGSVGGVTMPAVARDAVNYGIFFAVLAIVNGYALSTFKSYDDAIVENDFIFEKRLARLSLVLGFGKSKPDAAGKVRPRFQLAFTPGFNFFWMTTFAWYAVFFVISGFNNFDGSGLGTTYSYGGSAQEAALYSLADLLTNWSSLLIFVILAAVLIGGLANRRSKRVVVARKRFFVPLAVLAVITVLAPAAYMIVNTIAGITGYNGADADGNTYYLIILAGSVVLGFGFSLYYLLTKRKAVPAPVVFPLPETTPPVLVKGHPMDFVHKPAAPVKGRRVR